jgi:membrane associated rhomboid family serine protease
VETITLGSGPDQAADIDAPDQVREQAFADLLAATPGTFVTLAVLAANLAVYAVMVARGVPPVSPDFDALVRWGANYGPMTTHGQWWRLLSATFVHAGALHLLMNMAVLWSVGRFTERLFGHPGFLALYVVSGLGGSLASLAVHPLTASVGASGAVFGIYGGLLGFVMVRRDVIPIERRLGLIKNAVTFIGVNLAYGFSQPQIDLTAHIGGFLSGAVAGAALSIRPAANLKISRRWSAAAVAVCSVAVSVLVAVTIPVVDDWLAELRHLSTLEASTLALYNKSLGAMTPESRAKGDFERVVEEQVLPPWEAERAKLVALRLPEPQRTAAKKWSTYMSLMAEAWRLNARGFDASDTDALRRASEKQEEALVAIEDGSNRKAVGERIAALRNQRKKVDALAVTQATANAYAARISRVTALETESIRTVNDVLAKLKSGTMRRDQVADVIERDILPRWTDERAALEQTPAPPSMREQAAGVLRFMSLRGEGWSLTARALRSNDVALMKDAQLKQVEALRAVKAPAAPAGSPRQ